MTDQNSVKKFDIVRKFNNNKVNNIYVLIFDFIGLLFCFKISNLLLHKSIYISWDLLLITTAIWILSFYIFGFYNIYHRYFGIKSLKKIYYGVACVCIATLIISSFFESTLSPAVVLYCGLSYLVLSSIARLFAASYLVNFNRGTRHHSRIKNILIYGAGEAGAQVASHCIHDSGYFLVGFLDDNSDLSGLTINGTKIFDANCVADLVKKYNVTEIFVAIPSASLVRHSEVLKKLSSLNLHIRSLPFVKELDSNEVSLMDIRDVNPVDLLLRPPVLPIGKLMEQNILEKVILISGGGGSIGAELCRQIIFLKPKKLVVLDSSEYNLFEISNFLIRSKEAHDLSVEIVSVLGSVLDEKFLESVFAKHQPNSVFHAAAYKHVGLVQKNVRTGVENNIFGTLYAAQTAIKYGVSNFILISTDKAVRPTSVMGASKRVCEMILQAFSSQEYINDLPHRTCFSMVRFGNVLGSSGSVIPIFQEQIKRGGPVTVRHSDITRYFMSIPEAAQLVIQSGSMASGGEVFLLDMGEPIRIVDLAKCMILSSGLRIKDANNPDGDIEIIYTDLECGEKLYEELLINCNPEKTIHPKIMKGDDNVIDWQYLHLKLHDLKNAIKEDNERAIYHFLRDLVSDYIQKGI